jgi:hypothetical protein
MKKQLYLLAALLLICSCKQEERPQSPASNGYYDCDLNVAPTAVSHSIVYAGNQWNELWKMDYYPSWALFQHTEVITIGSDTLVNGLTYHKLFIARDSAHIVEEYDGLIREDTTTSRVYYWPTDRPERILYDFNMEAGDSIVYACSAFESDSCRVVVRADSIGSITIGGEPRKKINVSVVLEDPYPHFHSEKSVWIEGIGSLHGGLKQESYFKDGGDLPSLLCFFQDGQLVYRHSNSGLIYLPDETRRNCCGVWMEIYGN